MSEQVLSILIPRNQVVDSCFECSPYVGKNMKRWLSILCVVVSVVVHAQKISVVDFYLADNDLTANSPEAQVLDQNDEKCALIRVQTTQKGFYFDNGSLGIQKVDEDHVGEIWVYVPFGTRHISIRHELLGSLPSYDFPIRIQRAKTYILVITSDKVFVNNYDDTRRQTLNIRVTPAKSSLTINGVFEQLDSEGRISKVLSFGTYTYKVESEGYYPKEGQITINDEQNVQSLVINDLRPIMGFVSVHANASNPIVSIDGEIITTNTALEPHQLQIGQHAVAVSAQGFRTEQKEVMIQENQTADVMFTLTREAEFLLTSTPVGAYMIIDDEDLGITPIRKVYTSGTYKVQVSKKGYKDYDETVSFDSSNPTINISLKRILNYKNQFYLGVGYNFGSPSLIGGRIGFYVSYVAMEASICTSLNESEIIYWNRIDNTPIKASYTPKYQMTFKTGYAVSIGRRNLLSPLFGAQMIYLEENKDNRDVIANGANVIQILGALRYSFAIKDHLSLHISPEYRMPITMSDGFAALSKVSPKIAGWGQGFVFNVGIDFFFNL